MQVQGLASGEYEDVLGASQRLPIPAKLRAGEQIDGLEVLKLVADTIALNLTARLQVVRTLHLRGGLRAVVNLLDARADRAWAERGIYLASKAALESITLTAAQEWAPETRVNGVALGPVEPENADDRWGAKHSDAVLAMLALGRPVRPAEVARVVALLLSEQARVDTKPQLEIFADDVKCTHGATVGRLDALPLFYLKSRGISAENAKALLTYAFAAEVLETIELDALRLELERAVFARFTHAALE